MHDDGEQRAQPRKGESRCPENARDVISPPCRPMHYAKPAGIMIENSTLPGRIISHVVDQSQYTIPCSYHTRKDNL